MLKLDQDQIPEILTVQKQPTFIKIAQVIEIRQTDENNMELIDSPPQLLSPQTPEPV